MHRQMDRDARMGFPRNPPAPNPGPRRAGQGGAWNEGRGGRNNLVTNEIVTASKAKQAAELLRTRRSQLTAGQVRLLQSKISGPAQQLSLQRKGRKAQAAPQRQAGPGTNGMATAHPNHKDHAHYAAAYAMAGYPVKWPVPAATSPADNPRIRTIAVHAATVALTGSTPDGETSLFQFEPQNIINPLRHYLSASVSTVGKSVAATDFTRAGILLDRAQDPSTDGSAVGVANWAGHSPYSFVLNTDALGSTSTFDQFVTFASVQGGATDAAPRVQVMGTEICLEIATPYQSTAVVQPISPGDAPVAYARNGEIFRPSAYHESMASNWYGGVRVANQLASLSSTPMDQASQISAPRLVGSSQTRSFVAHGIPDDCFFNAGVLSQTDAANAGTLSVQYGCFPRMNVAASFPRGGFLVRASGGPVRYSVTARAVLRIVVPQDDGATSIPTLAAALRDKAEPLRLMAPPNHPLPQTREGQHKSALVSGPHQGAPAITGSLGSRLLDDAKSLGASVLSAGKYVVEHSGEIGTAYRIYQAFRGAGAGGGASSRPLLTAPPQRPTARGYTVEEPD